MQVVREDNVEGIRRVRRWLDKGLRVCAESVKDEDLQRDIMVKLLEWRKSLDGR